MSDMKEKAALFESVCDSLSFYIKEAATLRSDLSYVADCSDREMGAAIKAMVRASIARTEKERGENRAALAAKGVKLEAVATT